MKIRKDVSVMAKQVSSFKEIVEDVQKNLKMKNFSATLYNKMFTAFLNDPEFVSEDVKLSPSKLEKTKLQKKVVKEFRKSMHDVLVEFGMDEKDAAKVLTGYTFKKKFAKSLCDMYHEYIYQYLKTGKKLNLFSKEDAKASIYFKSRDKKTKKVYAIGEGGKKEYDGREVTHEPFFALGQSSGCPKHLRTIKKNGKKISASYKERIEKLYEEEKQ